MLGDNSGTVKRLINNQTQTAKLNRSMKHIHIGTQDAFDKSGLPGYRGTIEVCWNKKRVFFLQTGIVRHTEMEARQDADRVRQQFITGV